MYVQSPHLFQSVCNVNLSWVVCWFLVLDLCKTSLRIEVMKMKFGGALFFSFGNCNCKTLLHIYQTASV
jgi:hypothetical protein